MYQFRPATDADYSRIWEIMRQAKEQMAKENRQQWDESYPAREHILADIGGGNAQVLCADGEVIAYGAVIFDEEPAYATIKGKWLSNRPYVVVHRLAVASGMKHRGIATLFMQEVEGLCRKREIRSFKVDTNFDNLAMQRVLAKLGFTYCGDIRYQRGSRMAYEKLLD